jgi:hypothetical protein
VLIGQRDQTPDLAFRRIFVDNSTPEFIIINGAIQSQVHELGCHLGERVSENPFVVQIRFDTIPNDKENQALLAQTIRSLACNERVRLTIVSSKVEVLELLETNSRTLILFPTAFPGMQVPTIGQALAPWQNRLWQGSNPRYPGIIPCFAGNQLLFSDSDTLK